MLFQDGFPNCLRDDLQKVAELIPFKTCDNVNIGTTEQSVEYSQNGVVIKFPYRMYYVDVSSVISDKLNSQQKMILHCIYSRSCDGFVRQKHVQSLLLSDYDDWAIPYIVKLCDEYIMEILEMTYEILKHQETDQIKKFCLENVQSFSKSHSRMISYWNEFYRHRCYKFNDYVGKKLFAECFGYKRSMEKIK